MNRNNSFMLGLIVGGIVGGVSILLSTPKSGVELRAKIKENSFDLVDQLGDLKSEMKNLLVLAQQTAQEGKEVVRDFSVDIQNTLNTWKNEIKPNQLNIQKEIDEIERTLQSLEASMNIQRVNK